MVERQIGSYRVIEIEKDAYRIEDEYVRFFLVEGTDRAMLVDTGFGREDVAAAVRELTDKPVQLVITHADFDHIGGTKYFGEVYMHPAEYLYFLRQMPDAKVRPLWEGERVDLGGRAFEVILLPGHTPGSIALIDREAGVLISGDVMSDVPVYIFGDMRSLDAYIDSLTRLEGKKDLIREIWPSHGSFPLPPDAIGKQKEAALKLKAGELEADEAPDGLPAKMYLHKDVGFYY
jgi:glyoxylase-like metal-dependent hydrolase (beta-lactamase superfamily II)